MDRAARIVSGRKNRCWLRCWLPVNPRTQAESHGARLFVFSAVFPATSASNQQLFQVLGNLCTWGNNPNATWHDRSRTNGRQHGAALDEGRASVRGFRSVAEGSRRSREGKSHRQQL